MGKMKDINAAVNQFIIVLIEIMSGSTISGKYSQTIGPIVRLNTALKQIRLTIMIKPGKVTMLSESD